MVKRQRFCEIFDMPKSNLCCCKISLVIFQYTSTVFHDIIVEQQNGNRLELTKKKNSMGNISKSTVLSSIDKQSLKKEKEDYFYAHTCIAKLILQRAHNNRLGLETMN